MLYYDNQAAIKIDNNHVHHDWTKHIKVDHHFISESVFKEICFPFAPTIQQFADVQTKAFR